MEKIKIVVAGIGGVGGYFGGLLAKQFQMHEKVEISFLARGEHLKAIQESGLRVIKGNSEFICNPRIATDNPMEIGTVDYAIISTKSYDLESVLLQLQPCINRETVILPLLNGVDIREKIEKIYPDNLVTDGCVYIVSRIKEPGVVENSGSVEKLYFGLNNYDDEKLKILDSLFKEANIESHLTKNISTDIWKKYIFLSSLATLTSACDKTAGEIVADEKNFRTLKNLVEEVKQLALAKRVTIPENIAEKTIATMQALKFETTTSMHSDYKNKKPETELETLTGYVINEGKKYNVKTPVYAEMYEILLKKHDRNN